MKRVSEETANEVTLQVKRSANKLTVRVCFVRPFPTFLTTTGSPIILKMCYYF